MIVTNPAIYTPQERAESDVLEAQFSPNKDQDRSIGNIGLENSGF